MNTAEILPPCPACGSPNLQVMDVCDYPYDRVLKQVQCTACGYAGPPAPTEYQARTNYIAGSAMLQMEGVMPCQAIKLRPMMQQSILFAIF